MKPSIAVRKSGSELAGAIEELRKQLGMTKADLASSLGISWQTVWRWEKGITIPYHTFVREMLALAPPQLRHVFEDAYGRTLAEVSLDLSPGGPDKEAKKGWLADPVKHADEIHYAIQRRVRELYLRTRNGDGRAGMKLSAILAHVLSIAD